MESELVESSNQSQPVNDNEHSGELELQTVEEILRETDLEHELKKFQVKI